jgi:hypothetical protein
MVSNIDEQIYNKIRTTLEGVCSRYGYIRPKSIEILKRSLGVFMKAHFNGHIKYDIVCKAEMCNPVRGMIFKAIVKNKNDLGILAENSITIDGNVIPILDILIPRRSAGITSDIDLDSINIGDEIFIEVLGKRYQLNDKKISIIARAVNEPSKKKIKEQKQNAGNELDEIMDGGKDCELNDDGDATEAEEDDSQCDNDDSDNENEADDEEEEEEESDDEDSVNEDNEDEDEPDDVVDEELEYNDNTIGNDDF